MAKFKVEFKAFTSGDWYTKTNTDSCNRSTLEQLNTDIMERLSHFGD